VFKLVKLIGAALSAVGLQAVGYLLVSLHNGETTLRISGADIRVEVAWQVALVLTLPLWIALLRSAILGRLFRKPRYTSPTLLRRWIQMQNQGQLPANFSPAVRIQSR
jgi:hypothetical protein